MKTMDPKRDKAIQFRLTSDWEAQWQMRRDTTTQLQSADLKLELVKEKSMDDKSGKSAGGLF